MIARLHLSLIGLAVLVTPNINISVTGKSFHKSSIKNDGESHFRLSANDADLSSTTATYNLILSDTGNYSSCDMFVDHIKHLFLHNTDFKRTIITVQSESQDSTQVPIRRYSDHSINFILFPTTINETVEKIRETGNWHLEDATFFLVSKGNEQWLGDFLQLIDSIEYPGFIARFVLVLFSSENSNFSDFTPRYSLGLLCFLCEISEKIMWLPELEPTRSVFPSFQSLNKIDSLANKWNGLAQAVYVDWYSLNHPPKNCELVAYFSMQEANGKCKDWSIILDIVFTKLNLTREVGESSFGSDLPSGPPRLRVCIFCSYPAEKSFSELGIRAVLVSLIRQKLYYCEERTTLEKIKWNFFLLPISLSVWLLIISHALLMAILSRNIPVGLAMLSWLLQQPVFIKGIGRCRRFTGPGFAILVISYWYTSYITMDVVAPLPPYVYSTNKELLEAGYRIISKTSYGINTFRSKYQEDFKKRGIAFDNKYFDVFKEAKTIWGIYPTLEDLKHIVKRKGVSMLAEKYAKVVFNKKVFGILQKSGVNCNDVKESIRSTTNHFWLQSFLSKQAQKILHRVFRSGLYEFWWSITVMHMVYGSGFNKQNCDGECESGFKKLSMSSPAIIAFYMLGSFLGCTFFVFCCEKITVKLFT